MSTIRKQAPRLPRPAARYWKGKAPKGVADLESDSETEEGLQPQDDGDILIDGGQEALQEYEDENDESIPLRVGTQKSKSINVSLKDVSVSKEGKVIIAGREESGRTALEEEEEEEDEESEEDETGDEGKSDNGEQSSEYESELEEDEDEDDKPKQLFRPVFVPKRARITVAEREALAQDTEDALKKKELEAEERRKQSHNMVAESIKRELAEKEKEELVPDVDDTDGLDPQAEFEAWRLRELARIKKEKEEELRREQEREEVERRRAMPEEQRLKEDLERAKKLREEKPKGQQKFLQKYWHKGAFHQDAEILKRHDYTEATESTVDISLLPKVMQVKNFGKRSRTKYTHLLDQDTSVGTGGIGGAQSSKSSEKTSGCFNCGGPHLKKDCPHLVELPVHQRSSVEALQSSSSRRGYDSWSGRQGEDEQGEYERHVGQHKRTHNYSNHGGHDYYHRSSRRSRSRSRSPPRRYNFSDKEKRHTGRSPSRERFADDRREEKRRRLD